MTDIIACPEIAGVFLAKFREYADERGRMVESFRREWFPRVDWSAIQGNRSDSRAGVLRGLHFHHRQYDYWYVPFGRLRAHLVDLRSGSPTENAQLAVPLEEGSPQGLLIPPGVAHGFIALGDCTLTYLVNQYYDGSDEYGVRWDDPTLAIDWGTKAPSLSRRDRDNPLLGELDPRLRVPYRAAEPRSAPS